MSEEVQKGEEDGGGLLHAEEAVEGPFAVKLEDGLEKGGFAGEAGGGGDMLARVVALGGAGPEEEAMLEGCISRSTTLLLLLALKGLPTNAQSIFAAISFYTVLFSTSVFHPLMLGRFLVQLRSS